MPDPHKPGSEKPRSRTFGPPLLFLFFLLLLLMYVGGGGQFLGQTERLSQDQFEWHLYNGHVASLESKGVAQGTNLITGQLQAPGDAQPKSFEVGYASVGDKEEHFGQIAAEPKREPLSIEALELGVEGKWYRPLRARLLTAKRLDVPPGAAKGGEAAGAVLPPARMRVEDVLWVELVAQPLSAWEEHIKQTQGRYDPTRDNKLDLPAEKATTFWKPVELRADSDLGALLAELESWKVPVERRNFDLSPSGGRRWGDATNHTLELLLFWGPWVLILGIFVLFLRQLRSQGGAGGVMSFGRSRAQLYTKENRTNVTFDDVAGAEEAKSEVRELVEFLKNPGRFTRIGGRIPRGVLLVGPPGCGKTLLAKAIAGEAEVPFFSISGSDFVEMFVGVGASRVRDLFKQARENSPCILFLDEIDAVGRRRGSGMGGGHDEREQTLNAILVEMDGFGTDEGIIVIAATNRPDVLDPALLRPGRFDRQVVIDLPDVEGREAILKVHLKKVKHAPDVEAVLVARATPGYSGADLAAIVNEAAIMAVLDKREQIQMSDLDEAREKVIFGRQKRSKKMEEEDRRIVAFHEAGHAVVAIQIPEVDPPHKVTIVPRGRALGLTTFLPEREQYHHQKRRLLGQLSVGFGGRIAEQEFCGDISAGAADDIRKATELARTMVTELGMSEAIGPINYAERQGSDFLGSELMRGKSHSEDTARDIDHEVQRMLNQAYERAVAIVREKRVELAELAHALLVYETLSGDEVRRLMAGESKEALRPAKGETPPRAPAPPSAVPTRRADGRTGDLPGQPGLAPA